MTPQKNLHTQTLKYFWRKALKYKWRMAFFFFFSFWAVIGQEFITTLIMREMFDTMVEYTATPPAAYDELIRLIIWLTGAQVLFTFIGWRSSDFLVNYFQPAVMRDIEAECFEKLQSHSYHFFTNNFTGGLVSKTNRFVRSFERIADIVQWNLWKIIILFIASFVVIYYFLPGLAWALMAWTVFYVLASYFYAKWTLRFWRENATADSRVTAELADNLTNIFNVKIFAGRKAEYNRFSEAILHRKKQRVRAWNTGSWMKFGQGVLMISFEILVIIWMITAWRDGVISIGTIFAIQTFVWIMFGNLWDLGRLFQDYSNAMADCEEMITIFNKTPDILDPEKPQKCQIKQGAIDFKSVNFKYETEKDSPQVFKNFELQIPAGQKVGLVGESGAGKSTFVNLLLRFMDVDSGEVLIDTQNIKQLRQDDLRRNIAYVPQEPILFHRTLGENIAYGNPEASQADIIKAAKAAHAYEFIKTFPEGYDTLVGERGVKLSGGQKQRVAIARAMLKPSPILILDEATSSLDSKAENYIQEALESLMKNRTTLVIAHRLSTLRKMDRIVVFDQGRIIEDGTHAELLKNKGKYAELWEHQSGGFIG